MRWKPSIPKTPGMEKSCVMVTREEVIFFDTDCGGVVHNLAYLRMPQGFRNRG